MADIHSHQAAYLPQQKKSWLVPRSHPPAPAPRCLDLFAPPPAGPPFFAAPPTCSSACARAPCRP
eukprot:243826-Chlamydomonas_euryale.AAC.8